MPASFLAPRPGDGAYLVQSEQVRGRPSFLPPFAAARITHQAAQYGRSNQPMSFLRPTCTGFDTTSLSSRHDSYLATIAKTSTLPPAKAEESYEDAAIQQLITLIDVASRTEPQREEATSQQAVSEQAPSEHSVMVVPPHMRSRPSTRAESTNGVSLPTKDAGSQRDSAVSLAGRPATSASGTSIKEKLPEHGVKVTSPKALASDAVVSEAPPSLRGNARGSSRGSVRGNGRGRGGHPGGGQRSGGQTASQQSQGNAEFTAPPGATPAQRGRGRGLGSQRGDSYNSNQQPQGDAEFSAPQRGNPAQRGRGRGARQPRDARWPNKKDIPKPEPGRWATNWNFDEGGEPVERDRDSGGWTIDSLNVDAGDGRKTKRAPANAAGFKLTDFNGTWAPAPIDWDARPGFRDSTMVARMNGWTGEIEQDVPAPGDPARSVPTQSLARTECDLAPAYWVPTSMDGTTPHSFFSALVESEEPRAVDADDLQGARPWWELLDGRNTACLLPYAHPHTEGVDPDETLDERLARENDCGANKHAENRINTERAKGAAKRAKKKADECTKTQMARVPQDAFVGNRIKPGLNLYVRSAKPVDMAQIKDIYNHYVNFTCCAPETESRTTADMHQRFERVMANRLPFLVACERGGKVAGRRKKNYGDGEDLFLPDRVVGFATADDYQDMLGIYRFTAEIEVFVHEGHYMKGIAKCLLDKLLAMLDPHYIERRGFDIVGEELEGVGSSRVISNILAHVAYEGPGRLEWMSRWLKGMNFEQAGTLSDIGNKAGKSVSLAMFLRKTGAAFDPANAPITMTYPST